GMNIALIFEDENIQPSIETDELEFVLVENKIIRKWVSDGLVGGVGIFEPPEMRIELASDGNRLTVFEGILDMVRDMVFVDCDRIRVKLTKKGGIPNLTDRARAISFAYLHDLPAGRAGRILDSDFINIPYILAHIPNTTQLLILSLSLFMVIKEIGELIKTILKNIAIITGDAVDFPPNPEGAATATILLIIADFVYLGFLVFAIISLIKSLIKNLISPIRNFKTMRLQKLLERGAEHLGYTFESTFFDNPNNKEIIILPIKENRPDKKGNIVQLDGAKIKDTGFPTNKGQLYTYYDILRFFKKLINGKIQLIGNTITIERKDFFNKQSSYVLPDVLLTEHTFNANEIKGNFNLEFAIDEKDDTTLTNYQLNKTNFQRVTEPKVVKDKRNVMIKELEQVNLPVSLPTRKEKLTQVESVLFLITAPIDIILDFFKKKDRFSDKIIARIGMLHLANDFTSQPKIIPTKDGKVHPDYRNIMSAEVLHNNFYFINSFVPEPINHSQFKIHTNVRIQFCFEDYVTLSESGCFTTADGREGRFERIEGNPDGTFADVDFRIKEIYTKNLRDRIL
ncbi:MAG: hypothetical protein ACUZ8E_12520, partial [Candidatus Anammoxibacter sp.]